MASARPLRKPRPAAPKPHPAAASRGRRPQSQSVHEAASLYGIPHWGKGFFHVSEDGDLVVRPTRETSRGVSLKNIVDEAALRGISTPMVIRFPQILSTTVANLNDAFARAIDEYGYGNVFRGVFPIKVNQKRVVVDHIVEAGQRYGYGLEAGSKPELLAAIAADLGPECLITCNGYKDDTFVAHGPERRADEEEGRSHPREGLRARPHPRGREVAGREAAHRHARQALRARVRQVGQVGRRGGQVRPDDPRDARGGQDPEVEEDARTAS